MRAVGNTEVQVDLDSAEERFGCLELLLEENKSSFRLDLVQYMELDVARTYFRRKSIFNS